MRTAKYFAESSEKSTEIMKGWTQEMHEKTMSMHVITVFTLIFLPGTFVAVSLPFRWATANTDNLLDNLQQWHHLVWTGWWCRFRLCNGRLESPAGRLEVVRYRLLSIANIDITGMVLRVLVCKA